MRVIAGKARRLPLKTIEGRGTRPTTDRIKETLFNILQPDIPGCNFLDVFSGSGGIGIEALSRGAEICCFIENNKKASACIRDNLIFTKLKSNAEILTMDFLSAFHMLEGRDAFDIVFMDPPYGQDLERRALEYLAESRIINEDSIIIIEAELHTDFSYLEDLGYSMDRCKEYKTNKHIFVHRNI